MASPVLSSVGVRGIFTSPDLDGVDEGEVGDDPRERCPGLLLEDAGIHGRCGAVDRAEDLSVPVDALEAVDPHGGFAQLLGVEPDAAESWREAVGVVRLIVEHKHPARRGKVGQDSPAEGGVGLPSAAHDRALGVFLGRELSASS